MPRRRKVAANTKKLNHTYSLEMRDSRVRQANALARAGQQLDLNEKRLLLIAMSHIKSTDTELLEHKIPITSLEQFLGDNPYQRAEKASRGLMRRFVYIKGDDDAEFLEFAWTTVAHYVPADKSETGESYLRIKLNEELKPLLLELRQRYNAYPMLDIMPMDSVNSQRLYEVLWHDSHAGQKRVLTFDIQDLKFSLGLRYYVQKGNKKVWKEKYSSLRDFRRVLDRAQQDFQDFGQLRFTYVPLRVGRVYKNVRFHLTLQEKPDLLIKLSDESTYEPPSPAVLLVCKELTDLGYTEDPMELISEYGVEVVKKGVELGKAAERRSQALSRPIQNLPGLVRNIITTGAAARSLTLDTQKGVEVQVNERELEEAFKEAFESYRREIAERFAETLPEDARESLPEMVRIDLETRGRGFLAQLLDDVGWEGRQYMAVRNDYLLNLFNKQAPEDALNPVVFAKTYRGFNGLDKEIVKRVLAVFEEEFSG